MKLLIQKITLWALTLSCLISIATFLPLTQVYAQPSAQNLKDPAWVSQYQTYRKVLEDCFKSTTGFHNISNIKDWQYENTQASRTAFFGGQGFFYKQTGPEFKDYDLSTKYKSKKQAVRCDAVSKSGQPLTRDALAFFGIDTNDTNALKSLYCNGKEPGLLTFRQKDSNNFFVNLGEKVDDCSAAFDQILTDWSANPPIDTPFTIYSFGFNYEGGKEYFDKWLGQQTKDFKDLITPERIMASSYIRDLRLFKELCANGNGSLTPSNDANETSIIDFGGGNKTFYYRIKPDVRIYRLDHDPVDCKELAEDIRGKASIYTFGVQQGLINPLPQNELEQTQQESSSTENPDSETDEKHDLDPTLCFSATPLGWFLCPVIQAVTHFCNEAYTWVKTNFLEIKAKQLFASGNIAIEKTWSIVRNLANIMFIILILVVIFSQVTGVGIDNYGIKKVLPKIIICAILVNLSFILCRFAIDLSNILGNSLEGLFSNLGNLSSDFSSASSESNSNDIDYYLKGGKEESYSGGGALLALGLVVGTLLKINASGFILALFLAVIFCAVAVLFLFIILVIRQVGVIACVILAPIAFCCYLLPNTEKVFKKWLDLMKKLLLVFPICGLVVGLGEFMAKFFGQLVQTESDWAYALTALFVQVIPFFFIPKLLQSSLSAMGNVGAKLSGVGRSWGKGLSNATGKAIRSTERWKRMEAERSRKNQEKAARSNIKWAERRKKIGDATGLNKTKLGRKIFTPSASATRRLAKSEETLRQFSDQDISAQTVLAEKEFENSTTRDIENAWTEALDTGDTDRLQALSNVLYSRSGNGAAQFMGEQLSGMQLVNSDGTRNQKAFSNLHALRNALRINPHLSSATRKKAGDAYGMIFNGGLDEDGNPADLRYFSRKNSIVENRIDWSTQGLKAMRRAEEAGNATFDTEMKLGLITSTDPVIQSSLQSEPAKVNFLKTQVYRSQHDVSAYEQDLNSNDASVVAAAEARVARLFDTWYSAGGSSQSANGSTPKPIFNPDGSIYKG